MMDAIKSGLIVLAVFALVGGCVWAMNDQSRLSAERRGQAWAIENEAKANDCRRRSAVGDLHPRWIVGCLQEARS